MKKISALVFAAFLLFSCAAGDNAAQKKFGSDTAFFLGLKDADAGNEKEAARKFKIARKNGSALVARRSAEALTLLGSAKERAEAAVYLAEHFAGEDAQLAACRELFRTGEFAQVIKLTDGINLETDSNALIQLRLLSFMEKQDSRLESDFYKWFVSRPLSSEHLEIYQDYKDYQSNQLEKIQQYEKEFQEKLNRRRILEHSAAPEFDSDGNLISEVLEPEREFENFITEDSQIENPRETVMDYRVAIYRRKYIECFKQTDKILEIYKNFGEEVDLQILSDIGKAALYGSDDYYSAARNFDQMAKSLSPRQAYYIYFYAARLYDKAGRFQSLAESRFRSAIENADDGAKFDNALWYLLNFLLRTSTDEIITTLKKYGPGINSPSYFDDFFDSLSVLLLSGHKWQDFYEVWKETNSNFSDATSGKYAYISGRLIEEGLAEGAKGLKTRQAVDAYTTVLAGGGDLYYKVCALERLNLSEEEMVKSMMLSKEKVKDFENELDISKESPAGRLLAGYAAFGFPERIYGEFIANQNSLSVDDAVNAARFLNRCAVLGGNSDESSNYNVQSIRIASRAYARAKGKIPLELLELSFPRFYKEEIEKACEDNSLPEYLMYSLVRSESFFDSTIKSRAGASGLTQLMEPTAQDEARKAGLDDFDIFDPQTNLSFGAHYLASLTGRVPENNELLALFAYNAGLTNVRNWISAARKDWAEATQSAPRGPCGIPTDLFLETLPFSETREYGRKLVSAAAIYGWLYEEKSPAETVRELMF